ncbi:MAG: DUF308 domain-containing protein [Wenzhouxiangella sp.]|jgi:uncharacterized membrane protein HdeD (DUF308 family)|nr:DUF308 domain-containing protein [Wenzhouxiangella sp.]
MYTDHQLEPVNASPRKRGWLVAIGIISIILGISALIFPWLATLGVELMIGVLLLLTGILELVRVLADRPPAGMALNIVFSIVAIVAGGLLLIYPLQGIFTLTLVLTFFFLLAGIFKTAAAFTLRPAPGWGWMLTSGLLSLLLGILVLVALPEAAFWVLGILFGVDLLFFGVAQIAFATSDREPRGIGAAG